MKILTAVPILMMLGMDVCSTSTTNIIGGSSPVIDSQNSGGTGGTVIPPGTPTSCQAGSVASVRVGPFGFNCQSGVQAPCNNCGELPTGCIAKITATPKDAAGGNVPALAHGSQINWQVVYGNVRLQDTGEDGSQGFNKLVEPTGTGTFEVRATVCNVPGNWDAAIR